MRVNPDLESSLKTKKAKKTRRGTKFVRRGSADNCSPRVKKRIMRDSIAVTKEMHAKGGARRVMQRMPAAPQGGGIKASRPPGKPPSTRVSPQRVKFDDSAEGSYLRPTETENDEANKVPFMQRLKVAPKDSVFFHRSRQQETEKEGLVQSKALEESRDRSTESLKESSEVIVLTTSFKQPKIPTGAERFGPSNPADSMLFPVFKSKGDSAKSKNSAGSKARKLTRESSEVLLVGDAKHLSAKASFKLRIPMSDSSIDINPEDDNTQEQDEEVLQPRVSEAHASFDGVLEQKSGLAEPGDAEAELESAASAECSPSSQGEENASAVVEEILHGSFSAAVGDTRMEVQLFLLQGDVNAQYRIEASAQGDSATFELRLTSAQVLQMFNMLEMTTKEVMLEVVSRLERASEGTLALLHKPKAIVSTKHDMTVVSLENSFRRQSSFSDDTECGLKSTCKDKEGKSELGPHFLFSCKSSDDM